ncbi:DUF1989 domain-containing protein [Spiribacter halobius]|uniref:Aminomethyltransferase n=1 Tax=Sediminicurvatus halobius TaxID=2182432 RepID=A0A2U2MYD7_9GAMM|nr:urea carboxylase-associated family protein [Spiribacter halobius]PWG61812.1 aminomethyltransferase [Spiribacter halobius]UEX77652.1 urea carboxylase-associated family protein [Spiribacter halobius]
MNTEYAYAPSEPDGFNNTITQPISPDGIPELARDYRVPAREGRAVRLDVGQRLTIVNPSGTQVCDFWAFNARDPREFLSMEHLRTALGRTIPRVGDALVSNRRRALLTIIEDSSPGIHDTLIAACDLERYRELGVADYHDNCTDNLRMALMAIGMSAPEIPSPFNIWMNVPVDSNGTFDWLPPVARPGDAVSLRAEVACIAVMSACPQDITKVNGSEAEPSELRFRVD